MFSRVAAQVVPDYEGSGKVNIVDLLHGSVFIQGTVMVLKEATEMKLCVRKLTIWVPTRFDTNWPVQSQKMVRGWKFRI